MGVNIGGDEMGARFKFVSPEGNPPALLEDSQGLTIPGSDDPTRSGKVSISQLPLRLTKEGGEGREEEALSSMNREQPLSPALPARSSRGESDQKLEAVKFQLSRLNRIPGRKLNFHKSRHPFRRVFPVLPGTALDLECPVRPAH